MKKIVLFNFLFISINFISLGQNQNYFIGFKDTTKTSFTIKFKLINNLVIIPIHVNGSDSLFFILDTGIKPTLLTSVTDTIEFQIGNQHIIRGLGAGNDLTVFHTFGNNITIGNEISLTLQNIFVLENDKFELSKRMGMQINGIIGYSIFEHFIVEIDFETKEITFHDPKKFKNKRSYKRWINVPLTIYNGKPYADIKIGINNDTIINTKLLVDLGASDALWLLPNTNDSIPKNTNNSNYYLGQGLNGNIFGYQGKISYIYFNKKNILKNVTVSYPDTSSIRVGNNYDIENRGGTIGSEILRRFDIIIDYPNNRMLLKRNSNFRDHFNFDLSGMDVEAPFMGFKIFTVFNVHPNSPANDAEIMIGDQIIKINGKSSQNMQLNDIYLILHSREKRKVKFVILRDGVELKKTIILRDYRTQRN